MEDVAVAEFDAEDSVQSVELGIEFDTKVLEAVIQKEYTVSFPQFLVRIRKLDSGVELYLESVGDFPLQNLSLKSTIFYRESIDTLTMRSYFKSFTDNSLICSNYRYKMLSSIKFDPFFKCIAYVLMLKIHRVRLCSTIISELKAKGENGIYPELKKLIDLILVSQYEINKRKLLPIVRECRTIKKLFKQLRV